MSKILSSMDKILLSELQKGLPITEKPYLSLSKKIGFSEDETIESIKQLIQSGIIKRLGVIVNHHKLGFLNNAMVVFDIPDACVSEIGKKIGKYSFVNLCYRRKRCLPDWPFNLYCMIHGKNVQVVKEQIDEIRFQEELLNFPYKILFSLRKFKQCGAKYFLE